MDSLAFALFGLTAVCSFAVALDSLLELEKKFLSFILFGGYGLVFGVAPGYIYWDEIDGTARVSIACFGGLLGLLLGRSLARKMFGPAVPLNLESLRGQIGRRTLVVSVGVGLLGVFLFAYGTAGSFGSFVASSRFQYRLVQENSWAAVGGLYLLPFLLLGPASLIADGGRVRRLVGILLGLALALCAFSFLKGTRSLAIGIAFTLVVLWLITRPRESDGIQAESRPSHTKLLLGAIGLSLVVVVLLPIMHQARQGVANGGFFATVSSEGRSPVAVEDDRSIFERDPINYSMFLEQVVRVFPEDQEFLWLYPVRRVLFVAAPGSDLKPADTNKVVAAAIGKGENETTIPPSLPGEGYVVGGGLLGILPWCAVYGLALGWSESRQGNRVVALALVAVGMTQALLALRGQFYEVTMTLLITLAVSAVMAHTVLRVRKTSGE